MNSNSSLDPKPVGKDDFVPSHLQWLKFEAPGFSLRGESVKVLLTPNEFYTAVLNGCKEAKRRITLAAMYIGMGSLEQKLVEVLDGRMAECGHDLSVTILLDAVRGARDDSACTLLLPLIRRHQHCNVSLFHNPELRGLLLRLLPAKANEAIGVQHIKLYVFDDNIIISGANMTKEYFTDRQDRYMLVSNCKPMADFCEGLVEKLCSVSLRLTQDNSLEPPKHLHPYLSPKDLYVKYACNVVWGYYQQALKRSKKTLNPGDDTWMFPVLQLPPLKVSQDSCVTQTLLECGKRQSVIHLTSPYFNPPEKYIISLLHKCRATFNILIAHPKASDFHGAKGFVGKIPELYSVLAQNFLGRVQDTGQTDRVTIQEFARPHGSFHCKGVWMTEPSQDNPYLTIIGSSNFNYRSVNKDLECQMIIVTGDRGLRSRLRQEYEQIYRHGNPFTLSQLSSQPERRTRLWQNVFLWLFKGFF